MKGEKLTRIRPDLIIDLIAIFLGIGAVFEFATWLTYSPGFTHQKLAQMLHFAFDRAP